MNILRLAMALAVTVHCAPVAPVVPPLVAVNRERVVEKTEVVFSGTSYTTRRAGVSVTYLDGTPEQLGARHGRLLRDRMFKNEDVVWTQFEHYVPISPLRDLLVRMERVRYHDVDANVPEPRRHELAALAVAEQPDPNTSHMPTYERTVFLHSVYDIALSVEGSPLLGCSAFALGASATKDGHVLVGRAFDMELGDVFDLDKTVFFVNEPGRIPYASVAWPGMTGVITGMNLAGVMVLVNGARAGEPRVTGLPIVFSLREALASAHDTNEATKILAAQEVMVSHIVFVADAAGRFAVVERAPGHVTVRRNFTDPARVAVTNHLEGPLANDPKNIAVREHTTTLARRARLDEMLGTVPPHSADVRTALSMLRDHKCAGGVACPLGDRRAIDALIATHGVVADLTDRVLWVNKGPHLSGEFVKLDLKSMFAPHHDPRLDARAETLDADPILLDGRYAEGRKHAGGPKVGSDGK